MNFSIPESNPKPTTVEDASQYPVGRSTPSVGKSVVFILPGGIGEIIFCQTIAQFYIKGGYKVYWPVDQKYIAACRAAYPQIEWLHEDWYSKDQKVRYDLLHSIVAPLQMSHSFSGGGDPYKTKYQMYNLDWSRWKEHAKWVSDVSKENALYDLAGLKDGEVYRFASVSGPFDTEMKTIGFQNFDGYNIFDWAKIFRQASEIHIDKYAAIFLLELLDLNAQEIHIYGEANNMNLADKHLYIIH